MLVLLAGVLVLRGQQVLRFPDWLQAWSGPVATLAMLVVPTLAAYSAFQQARMNAAKLAALREKRTVEFAWWQRAETVQRIAKILGGLAGAVAGYVFAGSSRESWFYALPGGLVGAVAGYFGGVVYLAAAGGYRPPELSAVSCPGCGEPLPAGIRVCPMCGTRLEA